MPTIYQSGVRTERVKKKHWNPLRALRGRPQKKGFVTKLRIVAPKKPNSAKRRIARIRMGRWQEITVKIKGQGYTLQTYSKVLVCGGRANDIPGVRFSLVKGKHDFGWRERFERSKSRSKYGKPIDDGRFTYDVVERLLKDEDIIDLDDIDFNDEK